MGSSSSRLDSSSGGGVYTFRLFFYDVLDNESAAKDYSMKDQMLVTFQKLIDVSEVILCVMYYTNPLSGWQVYKSAVSPDGPESLQGKRNVHHAYIVFGTDKWWWSIEKNTACVAIQRSKQSELVSDMYRRMDRKTSPLAGIDCVKKKTGQRRTVKQLIEHIIASGYVNEEYHFLTQNCQHFADRIYDYL